MQFFGRVIPLFLAAIVTVAICGSTSKHLRKVGDDDRARFLHVRSDRRAFDLENVDYDTDTGTGAGDAGPEDCEFFDYFTEASNTELSAHTPDIGSSWSEVWDRGTVQMDVLGTDDFLGSVSGGSSSFTAYKATASGGYTDDHIAMVDVIDMGSTDDYSWLFVRIEGDGDLYGVRWHQSANHQIFKKSGGGAVGANWSSIQTGGAVLSIGDTIAIQANGTTIKTWVNFEEDLSVVDTDVTTGDPGIGVGDHSSTGDITVQKFDQFAGIAGTTFPPSEIYFADPFTGSSAELSSRSPPVGTSWTKAIDNGATINGGGGSTSVSGLTDTGVLYVSNDTYSSADYIVRCTQANGDTTDDYNVMVIRYQDSNNYYALEWNETDSNLYEVDGGSQSTLVSSMGAIADSSIVELKMVGTTISVYDDGVQIGSTTDSTISSAGKGGYGIGYVLPNSSAADPGSQSIKNFQVREDCS